MPDEADGPIDGGNALDIEGHQAGGAETDAAGAKEQSDCRCRWRHKGDKVVR